VCSGLSVFCVFPQATGDGLYRGYDQADDPIYWPLQVVPISVPNCIGAVIVLNSTDVSINSIWLRASVVSHSNPLSAHASSQLSPNSEGYHPVDFGGKGGGEGGGGEGGDGGGGDGGGGEGGDDGGGGQI